MTDETLKPNFVTLIKEAQEIVESKYIFQKFVEHTPLENDIAVWMTEFALSAMKRCETEQSLRAENERLKAENAKYKEVFEAAEKANDVFRNEYKQALQSKQGEG